MANLPRPDNEQTQVERARLELARTNELIAQIKTEIRVFEKRRGELRAEIEAENRELKLQREKDAIEVEKKAKAALQPLEAERQALRIDINRAHRDYQDLDTQVVGTRQELSSVREQVGRANREVEAAKAAKEKLETQAVGVTAQITNLTAQIQPLKDELIQLQDELAGLTTRQEQASWELSATQADFIAKRTALEREVTELAHKRRDLASNLNVEMKQYENTRTALVEWQEKLEKREKIVGAREYKAAIAEDRIATNANLLNL